MSKPSYLTGQESSLTGVVGKGPWKYVEATIGEQVVMGGRQKYRSRTFSSGVPASVLGMPSGAGLSRF